ncbi:hypothetical protein [Teredinibacter turnerae]|uniref:hypothetical protein n=1 Tax=Teredinibacter turnerae TaxID=2426 RepID=UPI00048FA338|nr:hypothetical protein [Teredinibacter turnerae]
MRKVTPESIGAMVILILLIALPIGVGIAITKLFRQVKPIEKEEVVGLASVGNSTGDGFFKMAVIGWLICAPIYYWAYAQGYFGQW